MDTPGPLVYRCLGTTAKGTPWGLLPCTQLCFKPFSLQLGTKSSLKESDYILGTGLYVGLGPKELVLLLPHGWHRDG